MFLVGSQIEIGSGMNTFQLFEAHREIKLNISRSIGVMSEIQMVVKPEFLGWNSQVMVPFHSFFFPILVPLQFLAWPNKKLHLHLFELPHPEYELAGDYLVSECLSYLGYAEGDLEPTGLLHIQEVHKDSLCGFGPKINGTSFVGN